MPTGSGKTWVYALIAKNYLNQGKNVTIIEPNEILAAQTTELIGGLDHNLTITSISSFYEIPNKDEVLIVNEYHHIVQESPFCIANNTLAGLWNMCNRTVFFCTATSNKRLEKIIFQVVGNPVVMQFPSEYELMYKVSPIEGGKIKTCSSKAAMFESLEDDIF